MRSEQAAPFYEMHVIYSLCNTATTITNFLLNIKYLFTFFTINIYNFCIGYTWQKKEAPRYEEASLIIVNHALLLSLLFLFYSWRGDGIVGL